MFYFKQLNIFNRKDRFFVDTLALYFGDDAQLRVTEELDDVADEGTVGHLLLNLVDGIEEGRLAVEHEAVGVGDVLQRLLVDAMLTSHLHVDTAILDVLGADNVGRHVLGERGTSLNHSATAHTGLSILDDAGGEDDTILDEAVAGNLRTIAENTTVADLGIVADVGTLHEDVVVAENSLAATMSGTIDDDILADDVIVAQDALRFLAAELEVLRQGTDDAALVHLIILAHARTI